MNATITNNNNSIEEQINNGFKTSVADLPEDISKPVEDTLDYIKKRAKCNDYEAAQIQNLMSDHSGQKKGFEYYTRYIAGQSTPEEDKADYYISIRKSWDNFLVKFANMTQDERIDAFTVYSGPEKALEILKNSDEHKLNFITSKTEKQLNALESKASELQSKSKTYLSTHLNYTLKSAKDIEDKSDVYFESVIKADIQHNIYNNNDTTVVKESDREIIHNNANKNKYQLIDKIQKAHSDMFLETNINKVIDLNHIQKNDLLQFNVNKKDHKSFKWFAVSDVRKDDDMKILDLLTLDYYPYNEKNEKIRLDSEDEGLNSEIKSIRPFMQELVNIPFEKLESIDNRILNHILLKEDNMEDFLCYAHDIDSSDLFRKLKEMPPLLMKKEEEEDEDGGKGIVSSIVAIISGVVSLIFGAIMLKAAIGTAGFTAGITSAGALPAIGLIITGLGGIITGVKKLITNISILSNPTSFQNDHSTEMRRLKENIKDYNKILNKYQRKKHRPAI